MIWWCPIWMNDVGTSSHFIAFPWLSAHERLSTPVLFASVGRPSVLDLCVFVSDSHLVMEIKCYYLASKFVLLATEVSFMLPQWSSFLSPKWSSFVSPQWFSFVSPQWPSFVSPQWPSFVGCYVHLNKQHQAIWRHMWRQFWDAMHSWW